MSRRLAELIEQISSQALKEAEQANVVVANGDPLDVKTDVKQVYIAGRAIPMTSRQTVLRDHYSK